MSVNSYVKHSLKAIRPFLTRGGITGLNSLSVRLDHHGHDKPAVPINPAPNDHLNFKVQTLDDLPEPEDYYADYNKNQKKYWRDFFFGTSVLIATLYYIYAYEPIMFNAFPPELPPKEERIKSFWVEPDDDDEDDD